MKTLNELIEKENARLKELFNNGKPELSSWGFVAGEEIREEIRKETKGKSISLYNRERNTYKIYNNYRSLNFVKLFLKKKKANVSSWGDTFRPVEFILDEESKEFGEMTIPQIDKEIKKRDMASEEKEEKKNDEAYNEFVGLAKELNININSFFKLKNNFRNLNYDVTRRVENKFDN